MMVYLVEYEGEDYYVPWAMLGIYSSMEKATAAAEVFNDLYGRDTRITEYELDIPC